MRLAARALPSGKSVIMLERRSISASRSRHALPTTLHFLDDRPADLHASLRRCPLIRASRFTSWEDWRQIRCTSTRAWKGKSRGEEKVNAWETGN